MQNILKALILAKQEFKHIPKNSYNPYHKSKYANLDTILAAISKSLNKYDLYLFQPTNVKDGQTILKTIIYHMESGEQFTGEILLPQNTDPQKTGSAITYYRRYTLCSLLGIVADEDDDGNATIPQNNQSTSLKSQSEPLPAFASTPKNIPYDDEEAKARTIYEEMKKANVSKEIVLTIVSTKFKTNNVRSLSWEQIKQLKTYIQIESKKSNKQLTVDS